MSRISDFLHAFAGWYAQLTLLRRVLLASALLIVLTPVLITLSWLFGRYGCAFVALVTGDLDVLLGAQCSGSAN